MAEPKPHSGRVAIVTGAGSGQGGAGGIGRGVALRLADYGAHVLFADIDDGAEATAVLVRGRGVESQSFVGDLASEDVVKSMMDKAMERWGRIDILVNNAGGIRPFLDHDAQSLTQTHRTQPLDDRMVLPQGTAPYAEGELRSHHRPPSRPPGCRT
jgi:NAD(P)-dependent dehydrogenase (short-subunit alcohol dehydrogenase family)